jgi:predicted alpha-1,2-mannosidase
MYTIFSLWDTYRTLHPLMALVYPERQSDFIKTMIDQYKEGGFLPKWELTSDETYVMVGDPALPVIADSYIKGIRDFDVQTAYEAMVKSSTQIINNPIRPGLGQYIKHGYIPQDKAVFLGFSKPGESVWGSASTSLEYNFADWALAQLAKSLGRDADFQKFLQRSKGYRYLYDPGTRFLRPKNQDGRWMEPFNPDALFGSLEGFDFPSGGPGFVEGNAWQYLFFIPHDINGLIDLMGKDAFLEKLIACFEKADRFVLFNEPDMSYPYLFNYVEGEAWRTQKAVR